MIYKDQLIPTGALNDVGATLRINVPNSYRLGLELQTDWTIVEQLHWNANLTLSQNKIQNFEEVVYDYTNGFDVITNNFENTDIAFSPNVVAGSQLSWRPVKAAEIALLTKYVGDQFLDNTSNENRKIDAYTVSDLRLGYQWKPERMESIQLSLTINNLFDAQYSANGYTFGYVFGDLITENFYYPQAGIWWMLGLDLKF